MDVYEILDIFYKILGDKDFVKTFFGGKDYLSGLKPQVVWQPRQIDKVYVLIRKKQIVVKFSDVSNMNSIGGVVDYVKQFVQEREITGYSKRVSWRREFKDGKLYLIKTLGNKEQVYVLQPVIQTEKIEDRDQKIIVLVAKGYYKYVRKVNPKWLKNFRGLEHFVIEILRQYKKMLCVMFLDRLS